MKKGPLTKKDKAYIEKYYPKIEVGKMAQNLDRNYDVVSKYLEEFVSSLPPPEVSQPVNTEEVTKINPLDLMGRNKRFGVVTMTEGASLVGDDSKKNRTSAPSGRYKNCIHKIRKDDE